MFALKVLKGSRRLCRDDALHVLLRTSSLNQDKIGPCRMIRFKNSPENRDTVMSSKDLLNSLQTTEEPEPPRGSHAMQYLKNLYSQQKNESTAVESRSILGSAEFKEALIELRRTSRTLSVRDIIQALKIITFVGVPTNSNIAHILLDLLRRQVNDLTLRNIIFLEFLLKKMDSTPLVDAIKNSLPALFELQLKTQIDRENPAELADILYFAVRSNVSGTCIYDVITALVENGTNLQAKEAQSVVWSMCMLRNLFDPVCEVLLNNCFEVLNSDNGRSLSFEHIESTLTRLTSKYSSKNAVYYNEKFWNNCAHSAARKDVGFENAVHILKKFNKIGFVSIPLLEYCMWKARGDRSVLDNAKPSVAINFITGLSNAQYVSRDWDSLKASVTANVLSKLDREDFPWLKTTSELMSLRCINQNLLQRVFDEKYLANVFATDRNLMNFQLLLSLYQGAVILEDYADIPSSSMNFINQAKAFGRRKNMFPLQAGLQYIYGNDVCTSVSTKYGHLIDHIIVFNEEGRHIHVDFRIEDLDLLEKLQEDKRSVIGVLAFPQSCYALNLPKLKGIFELKIRTLEALGIGIVAVNINEWASMPDNEKLPYLQREINYKVAEHGVTT